MHPRRGIVGLLVGLVLVAACTGDGNANDGVTELELFQFKSEAIGTFDELIADFEAEHPDIRITQNAVPDADAAIRVRLVREDVPDILTLNGNLRFGELAKAGVFRDFSADPVVEDVNPAILKILTDLGVGEDGEVNGIPFANNADGVIYNKTIFTENGLEPPTTWEEMTDLIATLEAGGVTPFYGTLGDAWTSLPVWNQLASNLVPDDFWPQLREDNTSFGDAMVPVAERMKELFAHTQPTMASRGYDDGNRAFAEGESAMYLQGSWAIPAINDLEPDFDIGTFALPSDQADETRLVSGVDVVLTVGEDSDHPEEALTFIQWLLTEDVQRRYAEAQAAIPARKGMVSEEPALEGLLPYFEQEKLIGFADHQVPASIPLDAFNQQFILQGDPQSYLDNLDEEWDKVARRQA